MPGVQVLSPRPNKHDGFDTKPSCFVFIENFVRILYNQLSKLEFGGESPLTMRYGLLRSDEISSRPVASFRSAYGIRQA